MTTFDASQNVLEQGIYDFIAFNKDFLNLNLWHAATVLPKTRLMAQEGIEKLFYLGLFSS